MYEFLDRRYALALYQVAEEKGKVQEYLDDLREICDFIDNDENFQEVIRHPQISTVEKKKLFTRIFEGQIDKDLLSFLIVLIEKGRIAFLREKLNEMENIYLEKHNTINVNVKSVIPLTSEQVENLTNKLQIKYNKKIIIEQEIDKSIIGGLYVKVGNDVIDGTIKSKLDEMKALMLKRE